MKSLKKHFFRPFGLLMLLPAFLFFACATPQKAPLDNSRINVGFDCDDTLIFSTPAFEIADKSGAEPYSDAWWSVVNSSDEGNSIVKKAAKAILEKHQKKGDQIYVITSRGETGGGILRNYLNKTFGIKKENVFFTNRKADKIRELDIKIYYGDSDSDIEAAMDAGAKGVRILRSPRSSYQSKNNPGIYNEKIIPNSEE